MEGIKCESVESSLEIQGAIRRAGLGVGGLVVLRVVDGALVNVGSVYLVSREQLAELVRSSHGDA